MGSSKAAPSARFNRTISVRVGAAFQMCIVLLDLFFLLLWSVGYADRTDGLNSPFFPRTFDRWQDVYVLSCSHIGLIAFCLGLRGLLHRRRGIPPKNKLPERPSSTPVLLFVVGLLCLASVGAMQVLGAG